MKYPFLITVAAACVSVAGCGSEDVENTPIDDVDELVVEDDEGYPVAGELTTEQQTNFDSLDRDAAVKEYDANQAALAMTDSSAADAVGDAPDAAGGDTSSGEVPENSGTAVASSNVARLRARSAMDFAFLDRNGDGQLSVAEYAIWAVRSNPRKPKENDETRPFTSPDQINEAGKTFFYFDKDGDTYLSPDEFGEARASARTPS
ncbi:hypothetical protein [Qipengyuania sp.]|uniref:hypothetical protein n=1 Tax=Qipengyuania sp. TaxID=2004515 RepID=UPI0035199DBE